MTAPDADGTTDRLLAVTASLAQSTVYELTSYRRHQPLVSWRLAGMYVAQTRLGLGCNRAGRLFGRSPHTALYAKRVVTERADLAVMADRIIAWTWTQPGLFDQ